MPWRRRLFGLDVTPPGDSRNGCDQLGRVDGFCDVDQKAGAQRSRPLFGAGKSSESDGGDPAAPRSPQRPHLPQKLETVDVRHANVTDEYALRERQLAGCEPVDRAMAAPPPLARVSPGLESQIDAIDQPMLRLRALASRMPAMGGSIEPSERDEVDQLTVRVKLDRLRRVDVVGNGAMVHRDLYLLQAAIVALAAARLEPASDHDVATVNVPLGPGYAGATGLHYVHPLLRYQRDVRCLSHDYLLFADRIDLSRLGYCRFLTLGISETRMNV
jgi:hypothetical protein